MISQIELHNFKCFEFLVLPVSQLTLLSGSNASGKSSLLQALVLLHQTMAEQEWSSRLMLNGDSLQLGTVSDVVDKVHGRKSFGIGIQDTCGSFKWRFMGDRTDMSMVVESVMVGDSTVENPTELHYLLPRLLDRQYAELPARVRGLTYITAERTGPRDVYPLKDKQAARVVGPAGEHTASVLYLRGDDSVPVGLALPNIPQTLLRQVEERMRTFFPGCGMIVQRVPQSNSVTLGLRTSTDTDFHRPIHVGFGLTQVLPIVVAALSSSPGDILLIENPEVHLHPAGQAAMGIFLAEVANAGIQVIVESHSDHVLNGIRRFVKCGGISRDAISLHFFRPRILRGSQVLSPQMDATGNIDVWPDGFFDQFDKDINYFAGWGEGHETTSE